MMEAIRAENLHKTYGEGSTEVKALRGVSVIAHSGEVVALLGPSGSGKSTLLTALGLLNPPEKGLIQLLGETVVQDGVEFGDLPALRRSRIGFVFQKSNLIPFLTAHENVRLALAINDMEGPETHARAQELLDYLGVGGRADHYPEQLSGGEQQRVAVARALMNNPAVILADEPSGNLDSASAVELHKLFFRLRDMFRQTYIIVTHNLDLADMADRKLTMKDGLIVL